jgi:hypothetical protein
VETGQPDPLHSVCVSGHDIANQQEQVAPVFQAGLDLLVAGETDASMETFGTLPGWFEEIVMKGGQGLTAPGPNPVGLTRSTCICTALRWTAAPTT